MSNKNALVNRVCSYNKAVSDTQRMKMIKIIGSSEKHTMTVSDIAGILKISQPAATKHLRILYDAGLIDRQRIGACVYYSIDPTGIEEYRRVMDFAFAHASTPCPYDNYECDTCPQAETCA